MTHSGAIHKGQEMVDPNSDHFFRYAACYWGYHANSKAEEACQEAALCLLQKVANITSAISVFHHHTPRWIPEGFSEVHLLAFFGLEITMHNYLESSTEAEGKSKGECMLLYAAENWHEGIVKLLLAGPDV